MKVDVVVVGDGAVAQALGVFLGDRGMTCTVVPTAQLAGHAAIAKADWAIEAAGDDIQSKRAALAAIAQCTDERCVVSSDASVHTRGELLADADVALMSRHAVAHFFFPLDRLTLVELVTTSGDSGVPMAAQAEARLRAFLVEGLQRNVVDCADLPGYVANRVGFTALAQAMTLADNYDLEPACADRALAQYLGWPRTAAFGTVDIIGAPQFLQLSTALAERLPPDDPLAAAMPGVAAWIQRLQQCKAAGFYRRSGKGQPPLALNFNDGSYQAVEPEAMSPDAQAFAQQVLDHVLVHIDQLADQSGLSTHEIRQVMANSYGWR